MFMKQLRQAHAGVGGGSVAGRGSPRGGLRPVRGLVAGRQVGRRDRGQPRFGGHQPGGAFSPASAQFIRGGEILQAAQSEVFEE